MEMIFGVKEYFAGKKIMTTADDDFDLSSSV
jgi:hypothetical protein